ncbi:MAG: heavy metal translocating P-type ATPase [Bacteroidia bacterium]
MTELTELEVEGMTCTNCARSVEKYLEKEGGEDINVNFATKEVRFRNAAGKTLDEISKGIAGLGYQVIGEKQKAAPPAKYSKLEKLLFVSALFTFPLLLHMFLPMVPFLHDPVFQLVLSLPVMVIGVRYFGKSAWGSVKAGSANMDVLIFIGSSAAFLYSLAGTILFFGTHQVHQYLFYETGATIITLVLMGNWIEEKSVQKTTKSLRQLVAMSKQKAKLLKTNLNREEVIEEVDPEHLLLGDRVQANSGDQIVADGVVASGDAEVDESLITGESVPVFKEAGSVLVSGSIVRSGSIQYTVKKAGRNSTLSRIIELVKDAQSKKPGIQKLGDQVSAVFVPVVVGISILTFVLSYLVFDVSVQASIMSSVAVLVISCPCAMGLATPTAVMVGVGKGAKAGVLIKGGDTVEKLAKVKTVVFDKTGTLTTGEFRVKNFETYTFDETVAKNIVLHMEKKSSHPIAQAIVKGNPDWFMMPFDYTSFEEVKGKGLIAVDQGGNEFRLGSKDWFGPPSLHGEGAKDVDPEAASAGEGAAFGMERGSGPPSLHGDGAKDVDLGAATAGEGAEGPEPRTQNPEPETPARGGFNEDGLNPNNLPDKDILLSYCGRIVAGFDIEDRVKEGSRETIAKLHAMGIKTVMLSGDNEKKCRYVAERTGITTYFAGQLPEQKLDHIRRLSAEHVTAMVGDGINDAPALSLADVGISLGTATDIAKESAEVILLSGQIAKVEEAISLGRKTYLTIKQNLFWALAYNVVAIPIAAFGMLSPIWAAFSMAFSDVVVIGNSLRSGLKK